MKPILIASTKLTPAVTLDAKKGLIEIEGCSVTDNAIAFYKPVFDFVEKYSSAPADETTVNIKFEYLTVYSSKCIFEILKKLESVHKKASGKVIVNWYYSGEDMLEAGKNYKLIIKLPFKMIEH